MINEKVNRSRASHHFPRIIWRQGKRMLWNPVLKKALANRPEERVRLRLIDYLIFDAGWPQSRIGIEVLSERGNEDQKGRVDMLCYDRAFNPKLLIECKAENVKLDSQTVLQAGSYNRSVASEYVMLTNGVEDYIYKTSEPETPLDELPVTWPDSAQPAGTQSFDYWSGRGFAGPNTSPQLRRFLGNMLHRMFLEETKDQPESIVYLQPKVQSPDGSLQHYYRIIDFSDEWRVAASMVASRHGGTRIVMMFKKNNKNVGLAEINPELHRKKVGPDITLFLPGKTVPTNLFDDIELPLNQNSGVETRELIEPVISYFNQQILSHV